MVSRRNLTKPKFPTCLIISLSRRTLLGLRSQWTIVEWQWWWRYSNALAISMAIFILWRRFKFLFSKGAHLFSQLDATAHLGCHYSYTHIPMLWNHDLDSQHLNMLWILLQDFNVWYIQSQRRWDTSNHIIFLNSKVLELCQGTKVRGDFFGQIIKTNTQNNDVGAVG